MADGFLPVWLLEVNHSHGFTRYGRKLKSMCSIVNDAFRLVLDPYPLPADVEAEGNAMPRAFVPLSVI